MAPSPRRAGARLVASIIALLGSISTTVLMIGTFMVAYFSPSKSVVVSIDSIGEAHFEFWLLVFFIPFMLFFWFAELTEDVHRWLDARDHQHGRK